MSQAYRLGNERGFGLLHLIVSLGVLVAVLFFVMKQRQPGASDKAAQDRLNVQGVALPANMNPADAAAVTDSVQSKLKEAASAQDKKIGCAIEEEGCSQP